MKTRLILIRHGETNYNLNSIYCGFSNPSLNKKGVTQAKKLAKRLKGLKVDKVYASDLRRACKTAEIIFGKNIAKKSAFLREMNFGIFEGLKHEEILKEHPKIYKTWISNPGKIRIPEGENLKDLTKRIKKHLSSVLSKNKGGIIAVVTHYGPIRAFLCDTFKYDLKDFWQIKQGNCALNIVDYDEYLRPVLTKLNDVSHLEM